MASLLGNRRARAGKSGRAADVPKPDPADVEAARTRRRFARRQWRRRWLSWKPVLAVVLVLALVVGGVWLVFFSRYLSVQSVQVTGTGLLTADDVRHAARVAQDEPLARVDVAAVERRVESLAPVADATVTRQWPDSVRISITERVAIAVVDIGTRIRGMDADGVVFRDFPRAPRNLPLVRTSGSTGGEALREAALVVSALPPALARRVEHLQVVTVDQITLVLRDGREVLWGSAAESDAKAEVLVALLKEQAKSYDVSVPGAPTTSQQPLS
ncbi:cell division protein FtsQ/DivIB [Nocardioides bigeumensis]|uniref:cell division protein FtsQ/DivIB n=1 Tax=Nocardioides bigeumensis TaxID=433657 RepID=UPI0031DC030A